MNDEPNRPKGAKRVNEGLLRRFELPAVDYLARRIPAHVTSDHLTLIGLAGATIVAIANVLTNVSAAFLAVSALGLVVNWFGDSLDGTLARLRKQERVEVGFFIDHMADLYSQVVIILTMGLTPYVRFDIACLMLAAYLAASVFAFVRLHTTKIFHLAQHGFGPTELRCTLIAGCFIAMTVGAPVWRIGETRFSLWDVLIGLVAVGTFIGTAITATSICAELLREEKAQLNPTRE